MKKITPWLRCTSVPTLPYTIPSPKRDAENLGEDCQEKRETERQTEKGKKRKEKKRKEGRKKEREGSNVSINCCKVE